MLPALDGRVVLVPVRRPMTRVDVEEPLTREVVEVLPPGVVERTVVREGRVDVRLPVLDV